MKTSPYLSTRSQSIKTLQSSQGNLSRSHPTLSKLGTSGTSRLGTSFLVQRAAGTHKFTACLESGRFQQRFHKSLLVLLRAPVRTLVPVLPTPFPLPGPRLHPQVLYRSCSRLRWQCLRFPSLGIFLAPALDNMFQYNLHPRGLLLIDLLFVHGEAHCFPVHAVLDQLLDCQEKHLHGLPRFLDRGSVGLELLEARGGERGWAKGFGW